MADRLLLLLLCVLAGLLASTPARNSDLWLHLASGRWLSEGRLPDGSDPFSSTTQGVYWVNPSWLSDLLFYWLYQIAKLGKGTALLVVKGILLVFVAALLFCFRRRGEGRGILPVAGFLATLALGPWLLLQSSLFSLIGVLLTLYLQERPGLREGSAAEKSRTGRWLLVPLFALWANLDGWFFLGPLVVGLYAAGEAASQERRGNRSLAAAATAGTVLTLAGFAACLASPYYYHVFTWPALLGLHPAEQTLRHDPLGRSLLLSSFGGRFAASPVFHSPGAWAYYGLLAASAGSFVLSMRTLHPGRLLAWLFLAALSIYQARAIPFFAVAAAPILALNVQEWARRRPFSDTLQRLRISTQRVAVLVGLVLPVLAWPGWLQPAPFTPRGWTVEPDGSLVQLAERLKRWHKRSRLPADHFALTFSPEVAHYLAWYCPAEKGFVDSRWPLFDGVADDYARMRRCLLEEDNAENAHELAALCDAHQLDRILLHDTDRNQVMPAYRHLFLDRSRWELLAVQGGATNFRRRAAPAVWPNPFDYRQTAYHPTPEQRTPPPPRPPRPPGVFDAFRPRGDDRSADREEAALHVFSFDLMAEQRPRRLAGEWLLAHAVGLIGCGWGSEPAGTAATLALRLDLTPLLPSSADSPVEPSARPAVAVQYTEAFLASHDVGPSEPLLSAIRAARRALADNPDDGRAFLRLGEAYFRLARQTREANWQRTFPELASLRQAQMLTALEQAVLLDPDREQAHVLLAQLYYESGQMDRCLDHLLAQRRIAQRSASRGGKPAGRLDALRAEIERMEELLNHSEKTYQGNISGKTEPSKVRMRAEVAARQGLSRQALQMMQESSFAIYGKDGLKYQLDLMLKAGQCYQLREGLEPRYEAVIGFDVYHRLKAFAAAACGDYAEADAELDRGSEPLRRRPVRSYLALHAARAVLARPLSVFYFGPPGLRYLETEADVLRQRADRRVLRGLLALEAGAVEKAQDHFRAALALWGSEAEARTGAGLDFPARPIAQELLRRLQE